MGSLSILSCLMMSLRCFIIKMGGSTRTSGGGTFIEKTKISSCLAPEKVRPRSDGTIVVGVDLCKSMQMKG